MVLDDLDLVIPLHGSITSPIHVSGLPRNIIYAIAMLQIVHCGKVLQIALASCHNFPCMAFNLS